MLTTKETEISKLERILGRKLTKKIVLYAPTWRGETGNVSDSTERLKEDVEAILSVPPVN